MAAAFICSKKHKADSCFQLGMYCKVHLPPFGCSWLLGRVEVYLFIHWHLKVFLTLLLSSMGGGSLSSPGADQDAFGSAWWLLMVILRQRSCWCLYHCSSGRWWPPQAVERGRKDKLWGVKCVVLVPGESKGVSLTGKCELGYSASDWHKTSLSNIGLEWRANRALLRLDVPNFKCLEKF